MCIKVLGILTYSPCLMSLRAFWYPNPSLQKNNSGTHWSCPQDVLPGAQTKMCRTDRRCPRKWWVWKFQRPQRPRSPCSTPDQGYKSLQERVSSRLTSRCCGSKGAEQCHQQRSVDSDHRLATRKIQTCNDISPKTNMKPETGPLKKVWKKRF